MRKKLRVAAFLLMMLAAVLCTAPKAQEVQAAPPKISKAKATMVKGTQIKLKVSGTSKKVQWSTDKKKVATVNSKGKVTAKGKGTARITAKIGKKKLVCRVTVEAPKLNKKSVSLGVGNKQKLKLSGTTGKVKWSTSDKKVAAVNAKGVVTGKKKGTCRIYAKVRKATFACVVTVGNSTAGKFNPQTAVDKLSYSSHKIDRGVVVIVKNNYRYNVSLDVECLYYDSSGKLLGKGSDYCYLLESGREAALLVNNPYDSNYHSVEYSKYTVHFACREATAIGNAGKIKCDHNRGADNVMVSVKNNGQRVATTQIAVVFYKAGKVVGYNYKYAEVDNVGSSDVLQYNYPHDSEYKTIIPDDYKVFVNASYRYSWQ